MKKLSRPLSAVAVLALTSATTSSVSAQIFYKPNVLLLVDSSGSMEYQPGFNADGDEIFPHCDPSPSPASPSCGPSERIRVINDDYTGTVDIECQANERSRWISLVEVLTGEIVNYRCDRVERTAGDPEYLDLVRVNSAVEPYDMGYSNPFHRLISYTGGQFCSPTPIDVTSPNPAAFPHKMVTWREYQHPLNPTYNCTAEIADGDGMMQLKTGLIDTFDDDIRFGLMTFDNLQDAGTGYVDYADGNRGTWSYYRDYMSSTAYAASGLPTACTGDPLPMEVGARNPYAPAWEGRMVGFGYIEAGPTETTERNNAIEAVLLSTRPHGATPIAGMMSDAQYFMYEDTESDPLLDPSAGSAHDLGPALTHGNDPYSDNGCRENYVVLLTDGEPNLDLRPYCDEPGSPPGVCPFSTPEQIAYEMNNHEHPTSTYVVGFSMSAVDVAGGFKDCSQLDIVNDCTETAYAASSTRRALEACCRLNEIAIQGGTGHAYFAKDQETLRRELEEILGDVARVEPSHARPAMGNTGISGGSTFNFFTGFTAGPETRRGVITRRRWKCNDDMEAEMVKFNPAEGDDFVHNVNAGSGRARHLISVVRDHSDVLSERSVRPLLSSTDPDQLESERGTVVAGDPSTFVTAMSADEDVLGVATTAEAADILGWWVGTAPASERSRCTNPGTPDCNLVADVDFSTPAVVSRPNALLPDETYSAFASAYQERPLTLYVSTNDGFLHAFQAWPDLSGNNELWAFAPPAVLPHLEQYMASGRLRLNDGAPAIRDVVATATSHTDYKLERSTVDAQMGTSSWRTILVQSFGTQTNLVTKSGYFALDVTWPDPSTTTTPTPALDGDGPKFLWQLTTDGDGNNLFGREASGTPLITTLFFEDDLTDDTPAREIPVAVLPGGSDNTINEEPSTECTASGSRNVPSLGVTHLSNDQLGSVAPRNLVRCWGASGVTSARSLTIVRLDTGKIVRRFSNEGDFPAGLAGASHLDTSVPLVAPIVGTPAAFPAGAGSIADRLYVGDAEGLLWRVDVSSENPAQWNMHLMFDAFNQGITPVQEAEPIMTAPVVSTTDDGEVVILFSTGDQDPTTPSLKYNMVWSLTEGHDGTNVTVRPNWYLKMGDGTGERATGPLQLFNKRVFFSSFRPIGECGKGVSGVWGMHYTDPLVTGTDPLTWDRTLGGDRELPTPSGTEQYAPIEEITGDPESHVYGVSLMQVPTCTDEAPVTDDFVGGRHTSVSKVNPGKFKLIMHTGEAGNSEVGGQTNTTEIELSTPSKMAVIESWAAIVE